MSEKRVQGKKRERSPSPERASTSFKVRRVETRGEKRPRSASPERPSTSFKRQKTEDIPAAERRVACIQDVPPEIMEIILGHLSVRDVLSMGATCTRYHQQSQSPWVWRRFCTSMPDHSDPSAWQRLAILKYTQALHMQGLGRRRRYPGMRHRRARPSTSRAVDPPEALGYRRVVPTRDSVLLWDQQGTLFLLRNQVEEGVNRPLYQRMWSHPTVLCRNVKDFAVDPRDSLHHRNYVYLLRSCENDHGQQRAFIDVCRQDTGACVYHIFSHDILFTQICLTGSEFNRQLLLLTDMGKVFGLSLEEDQLEVNPSFRLQLVHNIIGDPQDHLTTAKIHSSQNSALYLTGEGSAYMEVHTAGLYAKMFGIQQALAPDALNTAVYLPLPNKVAKCALGQSHLCLIDDWGGVFMQGSNCHGQLGTGDTLDRPRPTQVAVSMRPVDVWCGLHHTLLLLQDESGNMELHGCGSGTRGRLPGCPEGSSLFKKLNVQVPRAARSICATMDCLFIMSSHDINHI